MTDSPPIWGTAFGQGEPLTLRLKGLLREYPRGSILKELIQNADDAGARRVRVTVDWRTHAGTVPDSRMRKLLGPALLVHNDAAFTEADFESIKRIGFSGKSQDLAKTGRFGIGFNAVYHVTDWPSFLSRDSLIFFDPHCSAVPCTPAEPGRRCGYAREQWWDLYPDFLEMYVAGGLPRGSHDYLGTIFRLPLRTSEHARESEISSAPYTEAEVSGLLESLFSEGDQLLLFLKSVEIIEVAEIGPGTPGERLILRIETNNIDEVRAERESLLEVVRESPRDLQERCTKAPDTLPTVNYQHDVSTSGAQGERRSIWRVCGGLRVDSRGEMVQAIREMADRGDKAVPWGGAAALVSSDGNNQAVAGRVYCFLPLPLTTGLPVHLNGFFDLDSSRHGLTVEEGLGPTELIRARWNRLLVKHVIAPACADLVSALSSDLGGDHPAEYYRLWPLSPPTAAVFADLPRMLADALKTRPVVRVADPRAGTSAFKWLTPSLVDSLSEACGDVLAPLSYEFNIPDPSLPRSIALQLGIREITPARVRSQLIPFNSRVSGIALSEAPRLSLRRFEWVSSMLRYCLSDGHGDLTGLPLAVTADGKLCSFGQADVFIKDDETRHIFAGQSDWFLHSKFLAAVPEIGDRLQNLKGIRKMTPVDVSARLGTVLGDVIANGGRWNPASDHAPNTAWLLRVLRYFGRLSGLGKAHELLRKVPLIPGDDGSMHYGGTAETPLLCPPNVGEPERRALSRFGIRFISGTPDLLDALRDFATRHPDTLLWSVTGPDLVDTLETAENVFPPFGPSTAAAYGQLLDFLARERDTLNGDRKAKLRGLCLFPTVSEGCVSLSEAEVYLPGGYDAPVAPKGIHLLQTGPDGQWRPLLSSLGATSLDRATLIRTYLLPTYNQLTADEQLETLAWIRDNLEQAQTELSTRQPGAQSLRNEVASSPVVLCRDGQLRAIREIYDPESDVINSVLGTSAPSPDLDVYADSWDRWVDFFKHLGWRVSPEAGDLVRHVDGLIEQSRVLSPRAVAARCMAVYDHLRRNLDDLKDQLIPGDGPDGSDHTLASALRERSWIPPLEEQRELRRYPGSLLPEPRLYRCYEVGWPQIAHYVASQRVLARLPQEPSEDMRLALGFRRPEPSEVVAHFQELVSLWMDGNIGKEEEDAFGRSLLTIYRYLDENYVRGSEDRNWLLHELQDTPCLWDGAGGFWRAFHVFQKRGECFGSRRLTFRPKESYVQAVYLLLGQKEEPEASDYVSFLCELQDEYGSAALLPEDQERALQVLQRLSTEPRDLDKALPLLTRDGRLLPAHCVIIADAPWFESYLDGSNSSLLHQRIDPYLGEGTGCVSLSRHGFQELAGTITVSSDPVALELCERWKETCSSEAFTEGLRRLVCHEYGLPALTTEEADAPGMAGVSIYPADAIPMSLYLRMDGRTLCVAKDVEGTAYYDAPGRALYLHRDDERSMLSYLAQAIQDHMLEGRGVHAGHLCDMIDSAPDGIATVLDKRRVRRLSVPHAESSAIDVPENEPTPVFDALWDDESVYDESEVPESEADDALHQPFAVVTAALTAVQTSEAVHTGTSEVTSQEPSPRHAAITDKANGPSEEAECDEDNGATTRPIGSPDTDGRSSPPVTLASSRGRTWPSGQRGHQTQRGQEIDGELAGNRPTEAPTSAPSPSLHASTQSGRIDEPEVSHALPDSHTPYGRGLFESTPARPFDTAAIQELFPNAQESAPSNTSRADRSRGRRSPGYHGPMEPVSSGVVYLLARSFEEGVLWLQDPKPAALFPEREAIADARGSRSYSVTMMGSESDEQPLRMSVDFQQEVLHFVNDADRQRLVDFLLEHGLRPGCELTVHRLENGGYRLGYISSPTVISRVPFLALDGAGRPVVEESEEPIELPCPVNEHLLLGQQRFADNEAWRALNELARSAPDLFQAIVRLLDGQAEAIAIADLYRLNFQIRPVSWSYFTSVIEMNSGPDKPFALAEGWVKLRSTSEVKQYTLPRMRHSSRLQARIDWPQVEHELRSELAPLFGSGTEQLVSAIISVLRRCIPA